MSKNDKTAVMAKTTWKRCDNDSSSVTKETIYSPPISAGYALNNDKASSGGEKSPTAANSSDTQTTVVLLDPGYQSVLEDERGDLKIWPYSDLEESDRLPVNLHKAKKGITFAAVKREMPGTPKMTILQSAEHTAEMPESRLVQKYKASAWAAGTPAQISKAPGQSVSSVLLQDGSANIVSEDELAMMLPKIAEAINKMDHTDAQEILPGISQSITKVKNGGNLVITTMTRKLNEEDSGSSGRGSPEPAYRGSPEPTYPVLNVEDLKNSKIYLVRDSKGDLFYVEDVTSDTQESAYYSSSRTTSESISGGGNSPISEKISKIQTVGNSGIKESTAKEIINSMYGDSDVTEIRENEEEWNERSYKYDIPRQNNYQPQKQYSKDNFHTSYMVEEPGDMLPRAKAEFNDKLCSPYAIVSETPWLYDSGMAQRYSQMTGVCADDEYNASAISTQKADANVNKTIERYTIEAETTEYPVEQIPTYASTTSPMLMPSPVQADLPQYSLTKVDVTPKQKPDDVAVQLQTSQQSEPEERPIYKTVAHIQTADKLPSTKHTDNEKKLYKIITSKASKEKEQETHMRFDEIDYKYSSANIEHKVSTPSAGKAKYLTHNSTSFEPQSKFRSEQHLDIGKNVGQKFKSEIEVKDTKTEQVENSNYRYDNINASLEQAESNMRVVRGSYLIKNTLDHFDSSIDDNINMFDGKFTLCKDNPLYQSDEDLNRKLDREHTEQVRRQNRTTSDSNEDLAFETVDRFSKSKTVKREPERPKQSITQLLLERLSTIDKKDIRQYIDVKHHSEDIYGDPKLVNADEESSYKAFGENNLDTVNEKMDLMMKNGKAYITVKVTAERITPVDLEFSIWRKNQAIVTRTIEIDLLATEHRRRIYYQVMDEPNKGSRGRNSAESCDTVLDSQETFELFAKILCDGEGGKEDIGKKTKSGRITQPFSSGMDILF